MGSKSFPPNYCSSCGKPISEKAKAKHKEWLTRYALRGIKDLERFKELWMENATYEQIGQEFHPSLIYTAARALNLPRRPKGFAICSRRRAEENERKVLEYLNENGAGSYKRNIHHLIFKEEYRCKTSLCADRTAVVRLFCKALKKPENVNIQRTLSAFLRRYPTEAEKVAVLTKLGVHIDKKFVKKSLSHR